MKCTKYHNAFGMSYLDSLKNREFFINKYGKEWGDYSESKFRKMIVRLANNKDQDRRGNKKRRSVYNIDGSVSIFPMKIKAHWRGAHTRCSVPSPRNTKYYINKGIRCLLSVDDVFYLFFRDRAWRMVKPSLDRMDSNKSYSLDNCRFVEWSENRLR